VQISSAWSTREGAPLGKNRYVELEIKKAKSNGTGSKIAPQQKPCQKMTEAVVMDGGRRGELVKVCADPSCRVHHPDTPSPEQVAKERADERKRIEKSKQAITIRHCVLAKVLERVAAPLKKADLLTVAQYTIGHLSYNQVPVLAKRQKVDTAKTTKPPQEVLMKKISTYDEAALSRLLLEISLLDSAYQRGDVSQDLLMDAAKRYRVDVERVEKAIAAEFAAKHSKQPTSQQGRNARLRPNHYCRILAGRSKRPAFLMSSPRRQRCQSATVQISLRFRCFFVRAELHRIWATNRSASI
jgi:ParB family transcriptional regulator, chromosome partitioning protein